MNKPAGKNRVMWLMNHMTLRAFEVPLLLSMGYEVFVPKSFPYDEGNLSASIDYETDKTLSIPAADLAFLNQQDFYTYLSPETARIANAHFDFAITGFFPKQLDGLVRDFKGTLIMRPFGLANGATYTDVIAGTLGQGFFARLRRIQDRFWFGQAYENLAEIERDILQYKAIHLPLGLAASNKTVWEGTLAKVLFICPRIKTSPYFNNIYREFKETLGDMPCMIGGAQPIPVEDPGVLGFLPSEKYDKLFRDARVMFYHSREKRHLHYHPLEAIQTGMPLIFMADGMLDELGGNCLPGCARTHKEARQKLTRVLKGDKSFIEAIRRSQRKLLDSFSWDRCRMTWEKNFDKILATAPPAAISCNSRVEVRWRPKVAIVLNEAYRGGTLEVAKLTAKMLSKGSAEASEPCDVVFYHPQSTLYSNRDFTETRELGIPTREFAWKSLDWETAYAALSLSGWHGRLPEGSNFAIPDDGANNLSSFDHWMFCTDRFPERVLPLRPYSVYVHDCLQRYIPSLFGGHYERSIIDTTRGAEQVLCTTDHACADTIQYMGVNSDKVRLVPLVTEIAPEQHRVLRDKMRTGDYFLWPTNISFHKNHLRAIEALESYYSDFDGRLRCVMTGVNTTWVDANADEPETKWDYVFKVRNAFKKSGLLGDRVEILGDVPRKRYWNLLGQAHFVFHPTLIDNGTLVTVEAASVGVPVLSHDYPPMRFYERRFHIPIKFTDANDVTRMASALSEMEVDAHDLRERMPTWNSLREFDWRNQAQAFWRAVRAGIA